MKSRGLSHLYRRFKKHSPLQGQIELTYRCSLNCIHCYCKGLDNKDRELNTAEFKRILDEIQKEGCLWLTLTGGDPLVRKDFLDIYSYAKEKGFIINLFTNGQGLTRRIIDYLAKSPPYCVEITLNGVTKKTYEAITQVPGSFSNIMNILKILKKKKIPLVLKSNCLTINKDEVAKVKRFTRRLLGAPLPKKYYFKYDPFIRPRSNGDKTPCDFRLSLEELIELRKQDGEIWQEFQRIMQSEFPALRRDKSFLYHCNAWKTNFFINPYGRLKFCMLSDKFSTDLTKVPFKEGFYKVFPQLLKERFKTKSKCIDCTLRPICYHCPARAYLETGDEEAPVEYFCQLAKETAKQMRNYNEKSTLS